MSILNSETTETFQRDGVVLLKGVFTDWIDRLRSGVDSNMRNPGPFGRDYLDDGLAGRATGG